MLYIFCLVLLAYFHQRGISFKHFITFLYPQKFTRKLLFYQIGSVNKNYWGQIIEDKKWDERVKSTERYVNFML